MALEKQINLFKVDTNAFLSELELSDGIFLRELQKYRNNLKNHIKNNKSSMVEYDKINLEKKIEELDVEIKHYKKLYKSVLLEDSKLSVEYNNSKDTKIIRKLDEKYLHYIDKDGNSQINMNNVVSMFESTLSRSFEINTDELTTDIFIVEIYYYDIAQDLIINGFNYNNKHYVYFSSSAGQIRTKKTVFVEEEKYKLCQPKLMCGLTIDKINEKGGMNVNKFLAYSALSNSATDLWHDVFGSEFDINMAIVVDDLETSVKCKVDNIESDTYKITENVIQDMDIMHTDGCGLILNSYCNKNFMVRLPFIKGLLGSFDFVKFIEVNNCSSVVKDIWGKEHDIIKDNIKIIFTKSQLKMYKYYESWDEYKSLFNENNCEACVCNMEDDKIPNARINYQMLQTLYNMTELEVSELCKQSNKRIISVSDSLENMLKFFGVYQDRHKERKLDNFQEALSIYPELLTDLSCREDLKDLKNSLVKTYRGGKLEVMGKFTFVLPDLYAFCEYLFCGESKPSGLLEDNEVFCKLYKNSKELDCLRSPSLYIEHAIRNNVCGKKYKNKKLEDWFTTNAVYISTYDLISRMLQLDVDGDKLLILAQRSIIDIAKRHMIGINPLYYEMKKAKAEKLDYKTMYNGLRLAFTGGNIGVISNDITKIWAQDEIGKDELNAVRWLCMETNFTIDYAKTLFKPTRPDDVDEILKQYHNLKVPYFFQYAKDKEYNDNPKDSQVEKITNSTMNKIVKEIKDTKVMFTSIGNLDHVNYLMLLKDMDGEYSNKDINDFYNRVNQKYGNNINIDKDNTNKNNIGAISNNIKSKLLEIEPDEDKIIQSLVKHLYGKNSTRKKKLLWYMYGEILVDNLKNNIDENTEVCMKCGKRVIKGDLVRCKCLQCRNDEIKKLGGKKIIKCIDCGIEFEVESNANRKKRCNVCQIEFDKEKKRVWKQNKKVDR